MSEYLDGATVLVIDADAARRAALRVWFEHAGAAVRDAGSGTDAMDAVLERPDLIVIDADLVADGGGDVGGDVIGRLKADPLTAEIPIIQRSTKKVDDGAVVDHLLRGADAHLAEPVSNQVLVATAEAILRTQDLARRLEVALSSGSSGIFDWSVPTGRVRWNEALERVHGMEPGTFGGTLEDFRASVHPDDRERVDDELGRALVDAEAFDISFRFLRADGSTGHMEGRGRIFRNGRGEPTRMLGMAQDVSARIADRQQIEQLRRLAARLSGLRTASGVLAAVDDELGGTNVGATLVPDEAAVGRNVVYSFAAGAHRLDLEWTALDDGTTRRQAIAIGELAGAAVDRALRYESERTNAQILQSALQPAGVPDIEGFALDAAYLPASESDRLGGDFFDVLELEDAFVVVVGDVAGHGLDATRQMGAVSSMLRTLAASLDGDPAAVIDRGRTLFHDVCGAASPFVTVLICRIDRRTGQVTIVSAGHPPPTTGGPRARPELITVQPVPPLGIRTSECAVPTEIRLDDDEWLALYTDGVFERRDVAIDTAISTAMSMVEGTPTAHQILAAGESSAGLTPDDRAVVVVARRSPGSDDPFRASGGPVNVG